MLGPQVTTASRDERDEAIGDCGFRLLWAHESERATGPQVTATPQSYTRGDEREMAPQITMALESYTHENKRETGPQVCCRFGMLRNKEKGGKDGATGSCSFGCAEKMGLERERRRKEKGKRRENGLEV
ncbi:hypothetical protein AMTR_s00091p00068650 [Amborella trichopoda]|uniref:Uncharacterized protein n=1 Tax=Amborella trichopoda TaxID=13333 RepID=W1NY59_AMBTC|nr:hypothetical protein AMTR_s00091p00068650 [Amborella trichopoda]